MNSLSLLEQNKIKCISCFIPRFCIIFYPTFNQTCRTVFKHFFTSHVSDPEHPVYARPGCLSICMYCTHVYIIRTYTTYTYIYIHLYIVHKSKEIRQ